MRIDEAQALVDQWIKENGVRYFDPLTNMAMLAEEVGEVARIMARRYGEQSEKESDKNKDFLVVPICVSLACVCMASVTPPVEVSPKEARHTSMQTRAFWSGIFIINSSPSLSVLRAVDKRVFLF